MALDDSLVEIFQNKKKELTNYSNYCYYYFYY